MRARSLLPVVLAASAMACSFLVDMTGLSGGPSDAGSGGGPADAGAGQDATLADGDAAPDAPREASGPRFCASLPPPAGYRFCSDFDGTGEDGSVAAEWGDMRLGLGGTLALDGTRVMSPPRALHAATSTGDNTFVLVDAPIPTRQVKAELDFQIVAPDTHGGAVCMFALQQNGAPYSSLFVYVNGPNLYGQTIGNGNPQFSANGDAPTPGTWHHLSLRLDILAGTVSLTYDAAKLFAGTTNAHPWSTTAPFRIYAGLPFLYQVSAADVVVDNVVVEVD
jgi:hypothetical protein